MKNGPIDAYLEQLDRELRLHRTPRRRLLAETADHLRASADDIAAGGAGREAAERAAVTRFGAAALVARRYAHAAASTSARTALVWASTAFAGYALAAIVFMVGAPSWLLDFPQGAPSTLGLQVAFVALALSILRAVRFRRSLLIQEPRLRLVANGVLVAAGALAGSALAELVLALTRPAAAPWDDARPLLALYAVAASAAGAAALVAIGTAARANAADALPRRADGDVSSAAVSLVEDVAAVARPLAGIAAAAVAHPARTCALVAALAFVGATAVDGIGAAAAATGAFEAAAIVIAYLTLGRALGLRGAATGR